MIRFANWWFLLLIPPVLALFLLGKSRKGLPFSSVTLLRTSTGKKTIKHLIGKSLVAGGLILALVAMARPQSLERTERIQREGIDIVLVLDVSGSMQSVDFQPNRLEAARQTIDDFILGRTNDRVSLVIFAGTAFTRIPLTLDHQVVRESLASVGTASVSQDGTAIGMAISVGLNRLKKSSAPSQIMILVTDGDNNAGDIDPLTASYLAKELGIKIYSIGVGSDALILPVQTPFGTQYRQYEGGFDEALLGQIAELTGGQYFRATDAGALDRIFATIDALERSAFEDQSFREYRELAYPLLMAALLLLTACVILDKYLFVQIP